MWTNFLRDGGFGMYPTLLFGFLLIASGARLMLRPERRFVALVVSLGVLTLGSGILGTTVGVINTFHYLAEVPAAEQLMVAALGWAAPSRSITSLWH
jgi:dipeptide/tripeptide permease